MSAETMTEYDDRYALLWKRFGGVPFPFHPPNRIPGLDLFCIIVIGVVEFRFFVEFNVLESSGLHGYHDRRSYSVSVSDAVAVTVSEDGASSGYKLGVHEIIDDALLGAESSFLKTFRINRINPRLFESHFNEMLRYISYVSRTWR